MKKLFLVIMIFTIILITGCSKSSLNELKLNELKEKLLNKETFVIYFDNNSENDLKGKLEAIKKEYNLEIYRINTTKITNDEKLELQKDIPYEEPSIVFVIKGLDSSKLSHVTSSDTTKEQIIARLTDMHFINAN